MNYKFEFTREEYILIANAVMSYCLKIRDLDEANCARALIKKLSSYDDTNAKPTIKQSEDANKNVKFVAMDEAVEDD